MRPLLAPAPETPVRPGAVPGFSVIVAAYQVADVIGEALASAFAQTVPPLEVVVCDDGSTDALEEALEPYRGRIRLLRRPNGGEAAAKNDAARAASGEFVVILDADDSWLPERLEALGELAAARPDLDLLTTDAVLVAGDRPLRRVYGRGWSFPVERQREAILERNFVFGHAAVRRERLLAAGGFDEAIRRTADWDAWLRLVLDGTAVGAVAEPLARYRVRETSLSSDRAAMARGKVQTLEKASRSPLLRAEDRRVLERSLARHRAELRRLEAWDALAREGAGARAAGGRLALSRGVPPRERAAAAAAALAPARARRRLRTEAERAWVGAGATRVPRAREERPPLRVALYSDSTEVGGAELSLRNLLAAFGPGVAAEVWGIAAPVVEAVAAGRPEAPVLVLPPIRSRLDARGLAAHARALAGRRPQVLHVNLANSWSTQVALALAALAPATRLVVVEQLPSLPPAALPLRLKRLLERGVAAHVAVGEASAREVEQALSLPPGAVRTIHNAVPDPGPPPPRPGGRALVTVARLAPQKGLDVLLRALADVPDATLSVVGDGAAATGLRELGRELGVAARVVWHGWLDDPRPQLDAADVFVLPSRAEGFPLAVVEAMLAALPVVASAVGSTREAVVPGETGVLVAPEDPAALAAALRRLLDDPEEAARLGTAGRRRALARFVADEAARRFEELYLEVTA